MVSRPSGGPLSGLFAGLFKYLRLDLSRDVANESGISCPDALVGESVVVDIVEGGDGLAGDDGGESRGA